MFNLSVKEEPHVYAYDYSRLIYNISAAAKTYIGVILQ